MSKNHFLLLKKLFKNRKCLALLSTRLFACDCLGAHVQQRLVHAGEVCWRIVVPQGHGQPHGSQPEIPGEGLAAEGMTV